jgi:hypothetical protein
VAVSVELMVEVLTHAPATLTAAEKLLLMAIAESCNSTTRMTWYRPGWDAAELARRSQLTVGSLSKTFWSLAQKGCEVRVPHGTDKRGKPIYAHKGKQTTFKLPRFIPQRSDEDRTFAPSETAKGPTLIGVRSDDGRTFEAQRSDEDRTLLLKDLPSKNPSSLSPREDEASAPSGDGIEPERETDEASPKPVTVKTNPVHRLLLDAGCREDLTEEMEQELRRRNNVRAPGPAWFRTVAGNGELRDHVTDALEAFEPAPRAEPLADSHPFEPKGDGSPDCRHCPFPEPNRRHKVGNQGVGHFRQRDGAPNQKRSTGVLRAEQALRSRHNSMSSSATVAATCPVPTSTTWSTPTPLTATTANRSDIRLMRLDLQRPEPP